MAERRHKTYAGLVTESATTADLGIALADRDRLIAAWAARFTGSSWRTGRAADHDLASLVVPVIDQLQLAGDLRAEPGSPVLREIERAAAFGGASLAVTGASGFDIAAAMQALAEVLVEQVPAAAERVRTLFAWLAVIALDAFATAGREREREQVEEHLEAGTPVVLVTPDVPAALLVGAPSSATLDTVFGKLVMLAVRVGAPAVVVDSTGLADPAAPGVIDATGHFLGHRKMGAVELLVVGFRSDTAAGAWKKLAEDAGVVLRAYPRFDDAVARALELSGTPLRRRSS